METPESIRTSLIPGEWVSSIDLSDVYLHIPNHPNSRKYLRFCLRSQVFQFTSLDFGLATVPQVFTMIVKEVKLMALSRGLRLHQYLVDWRIRSQSREEAQVNTQAVVDLTPSHEALSVPSQGALEISSVAGQPPSLDRSHCSTLRLVAKSLKSDERCRPSSQRPQYPTHYRRLNEGWGPHLDQVLHRVCGQTGKKRLHINVLELKAVSLGLRSFKDQCQNQTVLVATDNSTVVAYLNKLRGTHSAEMCALLWKIMTWCHHYHITLKARHIPGCLNVMPDILSRSN